MMWNDNEITDSRNCFCDQAYAIVYQMKVISIDSEWKSSNNTKFHGLWQWREKKIELKSFQRRTIIRQYQLREDLSIFFNFQ